MRCDCVSADEYFAVIERLILQRGLFLSNEGDSDGLRVKVKVKL